MLKRALRLYKRGVWRGFGPGRRLITTHALYGGALIATYICLVVASLSKSNTLFAIGWGVHALSYAIAATLPYCKAGKRSRAIRIKRRVAITLIITVSIVVSYLFVQQQG